MTFKKYFQAVHWGQSEILPFKMSRSVQRNGWLTSSEGKFMAGELSTLGYNDESMIWMGSESSRIMRGTGLGFRVQDKLM